VLQRVEDYVEKSGKFRTECASFKHPSHDGRGQSYWTSVSRDDSHIS